MHRPVMLDEVCDALNVHEGGRYVDCTFGAGGYSRALLSRADISLLALDRDPGVKPHADKLTSEFGAHFSFVLTPFSGLETALDAQGWDGVQGVVLDIGVSSMQIDTPERGFSFRFDGPLDMRMGNSGPSAADAVNLLNAEQLSAIFRTFGEERGARRAAAAIVAARVAAPITTTGALAELMAKVLGAGWQKIHPATRVFQALRIYVNDELGELARVLVAAERMLLPAGRLVVVAFHSLEDRIVKRFFRERAEQASLGSRHVPQEQDANFTPSFTLPFRKAMKPGKEEIAANPRARSARMRVGVRTKAAAMPATAFDFPGIPTLATLEAMQ
jgi:16S rRNA (cytosine1402-N4)-methyltransferase